MRHQIVPEQGPISYWTTLSERPMPVMLGSGLVTGVLGEGGMAVVYEIWNKELGVKRAVKLLRPDHTNEHRERFKTEIKVTAQLDHANIIRIHSVGEWNGLPFIEMEKIDGFSLAQLIDDHGALPLEVSLAVGLIISRSLNYTHKLEYTIDGENRVGILHRDLKPANILISKKGVVRLTDFGIATPVNVSMHTPDGSIVGSLQYIAPEQLKGEDIDCRADIYSFGCVLYEMLTGFKAFSDRSVAPLVQKRLQNDYDSLDQYQLSIPSKLKKLISRCMDKDPQKRPSDISEVSRELGRLFANVAYGAPEEVIQKYIQGIGDHVNIVICKPKFKWLKVAACAAVVVGGLVGVYSIRSPIASVYSAVTSPKNHFGEVQAAVIEPNPFEAQKPPLDAAANLNFNKAGPSTLVPGTKKISNETKSLLSEMKDEDEAGNYLSVLKMYGELSGREAHSTMGVLLRLRALAHVGKLTDKIFRENSVKDAEFYVIKAQYLIKQKKFDEARRAANKALSLKSCLASNDIIKNDVLLCKARCLTASFKSRPDSEIEKQAHECWKKIELAYRVDKASPVYKEAVKNCKKFEGT